MDILQHLTLGDFIMADLLSGHSTKRFHQNCRERATRRYREKMAIERLRLEGYLIVNGEDVTISESGRTLLERAIRSARRPAQQDIVWDGKWRIVAFDIPEDLAHVRDQIRSILVRVGFKMLQQSVWIYPYDCHELAELIRNDPRLTDGVIYGTLENFGCNERWKKEFSL